MTYKNRLCFKAQAIRIRERSLFDNKGRKILKNRVKLIFVVNAEFNRLGQIQTEDSHDGFGIDHIPAGYKVEIGVIISKSIDECLDFIDRVEHDSYRFHSYSPSLNAFSIWYIL